MKKQYIFLGLVLLTLYIISLILNYKYKEYKINAHIDYLTELKNEYIANVEKAKEIIDYKSTSAYKNKILKSEQGLKSKGEKVVFLTSEQKYTKFTKGNDSNAFSTGVIDHSSLNKQNLHDDLSNYEKWKNYFLEHIVQ